MAVNLSVKNVPESLAAALRRRARRHHRSLQGELLAILGAAMAPPEAGRAAPPTARETATAATWAPLSRDVVAPASESALMIRAVRDGRTTTLADLHDRLVSLGGGTPPESPGIIRRSRSSR